MNFQWSDLEKKNVHFKWSLYHQKRIKIACLLFPGFSNLWSFIIFANSFEDIFLGYCFRILYMSNEYLLILKYSHKYFFLKPEYLQQNSQSSDMGLIISHPSWGKAGPQKYFLKTVAIIIIDHERRDKREKNNSSYFNFWSLNQNKFYLVIIICSLLEIFVKSINCKGFK